MLDQLVDAINPTLSTHVMGKPCYLFESQFLMALGASILERASAEDGRGLAVMNQSKDFPYREKSGMPTKKHSLI